ncbi:MAG: hypothetical protein GOVbin1709_77 [Prokaryotic dsDNA virus sp.]|nr:MAG: hypothetical protein GOVbin1709_77 [Prokaryotic dsDNA virus sp.]|tara:strand:+ start:378 stop:3356 length:2979 start_codon:yes stop_codon:yes gene_type:complete
MGAGYKPTTVPIIDYKYKVPFQELFTALQYRQKNYDDNVKELDALEESWLTLSSIPGEEDLAARKKAEYDSYVNQITEQVGGDFSRADSLIRNVSRTLKKDMTSGMFGKIANNAAAYKAMKEANDKRVKSGKKGQRITQKQADAALMIQLNKFYSAGGSEAGATFSPYSPVPYFDLQSAAQDFVDKWKPDQVVGNIYLEQAQNGDAIFRRVDTKEIASEDEILTAVMAHLESNDMASQYVNESIAFDMYGITDDDIATPEGQDKVKQARESLKNFYDEEDILAMSDKQALVEAMTKNTYANAALPYVSQAGYEQISSQISNLPESWYKFGNNKDEIYSNVFVSESMLPLVTGPIGGHTFENTDQLEEYAENLDSQITQLDIEIQKMGEELIADPGNESIATRIGELRARKGLVTLAKNQFESQYGPVYQDLESAKNRFIEEKGDETMYNDNTPTRGEYIEALTKFKQINGYSNDGEMWQDFTNSIKESNPRIYKILTDDGERANDSNYIMQEMDRIFGQYSGAIHKPAFDRARKKFFHSRGFNGDNFENIFSKEAGSEGLFTSDHVLNLMNNDYWMKKFVDNQTEIDLNSMQLADPIEYAATTFAVSQEEGHEGEQSSLSKLISSSYQTDPQNFVVFDVGENKVLDYPDNPANLVITGVLNDVSGEGGYWLKGYMPKLDENDNIVYNAQGMPLFDKSYLVAMNPYIGGNSSIMRTLADGLSRTGSVEGREMANRLFGHSFRQSLSWFDYHEPDQSGATQSVVANIDQDDYVRVDRTLNLNTQAPEFRLYHHGGSQDGDVIKDSNGSDMIFYSLDDATNMYEEIHKAASGTQDFNPYTNEYPSWVGSVGQGGIFTNETAANTYKIEARSAANGLGLINAFDADSLNMKVDSQAYAPYISRDLKTAIDTSGLGSQLSGETLTGAFRTPLYNQILASTDEHVSENSKHMEGKALDIQYSAELESYLEANKARLQNEGISFLVHGEGNHIHIQYNK